MALPKYESARLLSHMNIKSNRYGKYESFQCYLFLMRIFLKKNTSDLFLLQLVTMKGKPFSQSSVIFKV